MCSFITLGECVSEVLILRDRAVINLFDNFLMALIPCSSVSVYLMQIQIWTKIFNIFSHFLSNKWIVFTCWWMRTCYGNILIAFFLTSFSWNLNVQHSLEMNKHYMHIIRKEISKPLNEYPYIWFIQMIIKSTMGDWSYALRVDISSQNKLKISDKSCESVWSVCLKAFGAHETVTHIRIFTKL